MKIVIAPDSCKESFSATEVAQAIKKEFRKISPDAQYVSVSVADSGEGAVEVIIATTQGSEYSVQVTGPLGEKVDACQGMSGDSKTALIEMTAANDLALMPPEKRNPLVTTSHDTGELILQMLDSGVQSTIIGIGGNATNDGGAGMVQAPGAKLCDVNGTEIGYGDGSLMSLNSTDTSGLDSCLKIRSIRVVCDVTSPLTDDSGASRIFGPQKGTTKERILELDRNLSYYVDIIRKSLWVDVKGVPGSGVAGGMSAVLMAFLGTELRSGTETVTQVLNLEEHVHDYTLVVTDEGRIDSRDIRGKVPVGVTNVVEKYHKPIIGIGGNLTCGVEIVHQYDIDVAFSVLTSVDTLEEVSRGTFDSIYRASRSITATLAIGMHGVR